MTKKYKDVGITDRSMVWNTDLSETLVLENLVNQAEHEMYSATVTAGPMAILRLMK